MNEYEIILRDYIRGTLRSKVKGKLYVGIKDDILTVHVKNNSMDYEETVDDLAIKVIMGIFNSDDFIKGFYFRYKAYLIKKVIEENLD